MLRVSFHFHFLAVIGAVSCFYFYFFLFFLFAFAIIDLSRVSLALYPAKTTLVSQFFPFLLSLGVLRDQILPAIGYGLCGGRGCVNS